MSKPRVLLDKTEVARRLCLRNSEGEIDGRLIYDRVYKDPAFPRPVKFGRGLRWHEEEIDAYVATLEAVPAATPKKRGRPAKEKRQ